MTGRSPYTHQRARLTLRSAQHHDEPDGVWWPRSRNLAVELPQLLASWPAELGDIARVLYSRPDWDDELPSVPVPGRHEPVETGSLPPDDARDLVLVTVDEKRRSLTVVPPGTPADDAARQLGDQRTGR
jgi:hypothetical protein